MFVKVDEAPHGSGKTALNHFDPRGKKFVGVEKHVGVAGDRLIARFMIGMPPKGKTNNARRL